MHKVAQVAFSGLSGASDVCAALAIAGQKSGARQTVAFWGTEPVVEGRVKRCAAAGVETAAFSKKRGLDPAGQRAVRDWAAAHRDVDAFILHYPAAFFAVRKALRGMSKRPPILAIEHHPNLLKRPHEWMLSALLLWLGDGVVYLTDVYRDAVARKLGPLFSRRKSRTAVIGNGIELDRYQAPGIARDDGAFVVGMSGRMTPVKDYATLLRAFAGLRKARPSLNARLEFAGDGPMRGELEALAASLGIADVVSFLGLMPFDALLPRMRSWDAFVLSTHGETQPLALMEAMACGLPCIGSAVAGVVDVVRDGHNGILVPESDPDALSLALGRLAREPARRSALAAAALDCARTSFSSGKMWQRFEDFVGSLPR
ncbi:MAG: glycosyltransferase [Verrucomicrobiaceae bacterium]|nr:glycosyltransferase [Verrucomicrobiaceae bacterium]